MKTLKSALQANSIFSLLSGIILIVCFTQIAQLFEIENSTPFWIIGIGLIFFSLTVFHESRKQRKAQVKSIIIQDLIWVLASLVLILWNPFGISTLGIIVILTVAIIVGGFAFAQYRGLRSQHSS